MLYYVLPLIIWLIFCLYWSWVDERPTFVQSLVAFLPLVLVACLRGNVGTDTYAYLDEIDLKLGNLDRPLGEFEPGFEFVIGVLGDVLQNARAVVLAVSLINAALFYVATRKWGGSRLVGAALVMPGFFFDYTMNGLRVGMAIPLCILAYVYLEKGALLRGVALASAAVSVQMTSVVFLGLLFAYKMPFRLSLRRSILLVVALVGFGGLFSLLFSERVLAKAALYEVSSAPTAVSGLAPVLISMVLVLPFLDDLNSRAFRSSVLLVLFELVFFALSTVTYAGLRLQLLCLFTQALLVQREMVPRRFTHATLATCCVFFFAVFLSWEIKNFVSEQGSGAESPFLPYHFFWQADPRA